MYAEYLSLILRNQPANMWGGAAVKQEATACSRRFPELYSMPKADHVPSVDSEDTAGMSQHVFFLFCLHPNKPAVCWIMLARANREDSWYDERPSKCSSEQFRLIMKLLIQSDEQKELQVVGWVEREAGLRRSAHA